MYNLHHTEGIILSANDFGEADRIYNIYTKNFGKVSVFAKGVRLEKSKLRGHLAPHSLIRLSFIEGKEFMRLVDSEEILSLPAQEEIFSVFAKSCALVERMVRGQEKDENLWDFLQSAFLYLCHTWCPTKDFEPIFKTRLLHRLGYVSSDHEIITANDWRNLPTERADLSQLQKIYSDGLSASQL